MPRIAVAQLSLDVPQRARILVNGEKYGARHALHSSARPRLAIRTKGATAKRAGGRYAHSRLTQCGSEDAG
jgi:hypothetical protein